MRGAPHAMLDDAQFRFVTDELWDEFLIRYYKPVADACVDLDGECKRDAEVPVGASVTLTAAGASDDSGSPSHVYWDLDTAADNPAPLPNYAPGQQYITCQETQGEDCDRDGVDGPDDDLDKSGTTATYTCTQAGDFIIRAIVLDSHHHHARTRNEDRAHNDGRHWLHFQVDTSLVTITCITQTGSLLDLEKNATNLVESGGRIDYEVSLGNTGNAPVTGTLVDTVPEYVTYLVDPGVFCSVGTCSYDTEEEVVIWNGTVEPGSTLQMSWSGMVDPNIPAAVTSIESCASLTSEEDTITACAVTSIESAELPEISKSADIAFVQPGQYITYSIVVPANPELQEATEGTIIDPIQVEFFDSNGTLELAELTCNIGECFYDDSENNIIWAGLLQPGDIVEMSFAIMVPDDLLPVVYPDAYQNCIQGFDGFQEFFDVCASTSVQMPDE